MARGNDNVQDLLELRNIGDPSGSVRTPVTILFSDIVGSTSYFEKYGDVAGMAMVERHNNLLTPEIRSNGGRVVKTMGDAILSVFDAPVDAIKAAAGMQRALAADRQGRPREEHIHIRIGLHTGLGLLKGNDVYGDVVNAAARVQKQAQPGQILITGVLLDCAKTAGFQCAAFGKADIRGKDEPLDVYAVAWSESATQQLIDEIQERFEARLKDLKRQHDALEHEFESSREQWRVERRKMSAEIDQLHETAKRARHSARSQAAEDINSQLRFQLQEAVRFKEDAQRQLESAEIRWNTERGQLKAQITAMQASVIEAMERSNNPTRTGTVIREQVQSRLAEVKREWEHEWESERQHLIAEIDRLKKNTPSDKKREAARLALLEKLGKIPKGSAGSALKTPDQLRHELQEVKAQSESERDRLLLQIKRLENDASRSREAVRTAIFEEIQSQFESKLTQAHHERQRLAHEAQLLTLELADVRQRSTEHVAELEKAVAEGEKAARTQTIAEFSNRFQVKLDEANLLKSRAERKLQDVSEELDVERRRAKRQIAQLEDQLREAKEAAYKASVQFRRRT
jgi:class 3 adenylate cyclase